MRCRHELLKKRDRLPQQTITSKFLGVLLFPRMSNLPLQVTSHKEELIRSVRLRS